MHRSKGKWNASYKDTWSIEQSLNPIILAYLEKLYTTLKASKHHGVPMYYVEKQALIDGISDPYSEDVDLDKADELRFNDLEELIWVFGSEEPDILSYDFKIDFVEVDKEDDIVKKHGKCFTTQVVGEQEYERYNKDIDFYWERKMKGYKLFGEIYHYLAN